MHLLFLYVFCGLVVYFVLALNNISLSGCITVIYPFTYWRTFWLLPNSGSYEESCQKHSCADFCMYISFQSVGMTIRECIWWFVEGNGTPLHTLAWKIPWLKEPGGLQSMGLLRVGHDWATSLSLFSFMPWRRKWQPTPVFLPGESQGLGGLVGCRLWGRTESDMTEVT